MSFLTVTNIVGTFVADAVQMKMTGTNATVGGMTCLIKTSPVGDSVGDGIPDWWRALYFGGSGTTTNSLSCAACDADNSGLNNLAKYLAGINPTNPLSVFQIDSVGVVNNNTLLQFYANSNRTYSVLYRDSVQTGSWSILTNIPALPPGQDQEMTVQDPAVTNGVPQRFYRLVAPAVPVY
jgi:hypothetical protein